MTEVAAAAAPSAAGAPTDVLAATAALVRPALAAVIDDLSPEVRSVAGYHLGTLDADGSAVTGSAGKGLRPSLAVAACVAAGGTSADAVPGAVAVQLVHDFSLIHDDVMDGDDERRHRPTAWTVFGVGRAVLAGDALLAAAVATLLGDGGSRAVEATRLLLAATSQLITGQGEDLAFEQRDDVTVEECLRMFAGKTGALLGAAASIGAVLGRGDHATVAGLGRFGRHLGLAFQAVDDVLGIWGDPATTGKPRFSDLRQHKQSLPVVAALRHAAPDQSRRLRAALGLTATSDEHLADVADLVERAGGRRFALDEARRSLRQALDELAALDLVDEGRTALERLARFAVARST